MSRGKVLITGASSGIGESCAKKFAANGYDLILTGRNEKRLVELKNELQSKYDIQVCNLIFDVRDYNATKDALNTLSGDWLTIDVLINNAGLVLGVEKEYNVAEADWNTMIDTNIKGILNMVQFIVPNMVANNKGHIINIGSIAGDAAYPGGSVYCATKAAVKSLSDGLRMDLVDTPLRVTNIKPGMVETNFSVIRFRGDKDAADNVYQGLQPLTGDDIADTVFYAAQAPQHVQIAEVLLMPTNQASATLSYRKKE